MERKHAIVGVVVVVAVIAIFAAGLIPNPLYDVIASMLGLHDPTLGRYLTTLDDVVKEQHPHNLTAWDVTWIGPNSARVDWAYTYAQPGNASANSTYTENFIVTRYGNVKDASAAVEKATTSYKIVNGTYGSGGAFERMYGHFPTTFYAYQDKAGEGRFVWQFDEYVQVGQLSRIDW